jgi:hypothetical protein
VSESERGLFMLVYISLGVFLISVVAFFTVLFFYRKEQQEDHLKPSPGQGIRGTLHGARLDMDENTKKRLIHASSKLKSQKEVDVPLKRSSSGEGPVHMRAVRDAIELLNQYLWDCKDRLRHFDGATIEPNAITSKDTAEHVIFTRRMVQALQKRSDFLAEELKSSSPDYQMIYKEITSPLSFVEDTFHSLLSSREIPPVRWDDLGPVIKKVTSDLDASIRERKRKVAN